MGIRVFGFQGCRVYARLSSDVSVRVPTHELDSLSRKAYLVCGFSGLGVSRGYRAQGSIVWA